MHIAILGAGSVGGGLGQAFSAVGHSVVFGVSDPESVKTQAALALIPDAVAERPAVAVEGADVLVFALRPVAMRATCAALASCVTAVARAASLRTSRPDMGLAMMATLPGIGCVPS